DRAVARTTPVRGYLLGPLIRRAQSMRPADGVMVVGIGRAEVVDLGQKELRGLDSGKTVESAHFVEAAVRRAFGRRTVVADDVVDQRIVQDSEALDRVDQPAHLVVRVFQETR